MSDYIDKITDKDTGDSRIISPAAEDVRVDNENFEGSDLDEVLTEIAEAGSGGYTPPPGGIPKTDLAPAVQQTLDDVANKVDKVTGKGLSSNDYTDTDKAKVDGLNPVATSGSYNDLTDKPTIPTVPTMDAAPTAGNTSHTVSSDGVAAAIAGKANAADVPTKTEMADAIDDALGEAQVTVVPENSVGIINSLGSDSDSDALSAAMGKKLKVALLQILSSLGSYAFPNGKPTLDFDDIVTYSVQKTIGTGLSATGGSTEVVHGESLEVTIAIADNLYIIDEDNIVVTMGGNAVANAYDASTGKITIAAVTGNVVITVPSLTYVSNGLVLMLDGMNQGETAGQWKNLKNANKPLVLSGGYTQGNNAVAFDGVNGQGIVSGFSDNLPWDTATLESVVSFDTIPNAATFVFGAGNNHNTLFFVNKTSEENRIYLAAQTKGEHSSESQGLIYAYLDSQAGSPLFAANQAISLARQGAQFRLNNTVLGTKSAADSYVIMGDSTSTYDASGKLFAGCFTTRGGTQFGMFKGNLYCVRAYTRTLTDAEVAQNYKVDQKRFNL